MTIQHIKKHRDQFSAEVPVMWVRVVSIICLLFILMLTVCKNPSSASGPEIAYIALELKNSSGTITKNAVTDTVGKQVSILMIHNQSQFIDASTLRITNGTDFNQVYPVKSFKGIVDTVNYPIVFSVPGIYTVNFSCSIDGKATILNGTITIVKSLQTNLNQSATFALTINATNGSVSKSPDLASYDSGTVVKLTPVPADNYHFTGWSGALTGSENPVTITMNSAKTINAGFEVNPASTFALTVLASNGTVRKTPDLLMYDSGSAVGLKATPATGYHFVKWTGDASGTADTIAVRMTASKSVTANFEINSYQLTFKSNETTYSTATVNYNTRATEPVVPQGAACDSFGGWYTSATYATKWDFLTDKVTTDTTLYAKWTRGTYIVSYNANGATSGNAPAQQTKTCDVSLTLADNGGNLTKTGTAFSGWNTAANGTGTAYSPGAAYTANAPLVLFAMWKTDSLMVTFNSNGGSLVPSKMVPYDGSVPEPAAPTKAGFTFAGWYSNQSLTTPFDFSVAITTAKTLYAKWNPVYKVVYHANGGSGSVPVDNNEYTSGQLVTVLGKPSGLTRLNYDFTGWNTASDGTGANRLAGSTFQMGSKIDTLYANWKASLPVITTQPVSVNPYPFDTISFSVTAVGIGLSYQWYKDGVLIPTATNSALVKQKVIYSDSGFYHCTVNNSSGSATSSTVKLAVRKTVKDADSNEYSIVVIGDQIWTAENLRTTRFNDGTSIPLVNDSTVWTNLTTPGYCFYYNTTSVNEQRKWGALYNWYTVNTGKLAPAGWHVSTDDDWNTIEWYHFEHNLDWNNSGFAPLKGGCCWGGFSGQDEYGYWWTSTEIPRLPSEPPSNAWAHIMPDGARAIIPINSGFSIRLVKN